MSKLARWAEVGKAAADREAAELSRVQDLSRQLRRRIAPALRGSDKGATISELEAQRVSPTERVLRDLITSDFLSSERLGRRPDRRRGEDSVPPSSSACSRARSRTSTPCPRSSKGTTASPFPSTRCPWATTSECARRRPSSRSTRQSVGRSWGRSEELPPSELILTQYTDRGLLRGDLGTTFFLPMKGEADRVLAVAGMGPVGGCGAPELTILVRELCWALSRYGKKHLATVLIGSGNGNLSVRQCVEAWVRGLKRALDEISPREERAQPSLRDLRRV